MPGRTIAIGDIHGCAKALEALLVAVDPGPEDLVVPLGDFVDRGTDSKRVIEIMLWLRGQCKLRPIRGNHENMLLAALSHGWALEFWLYCGGAATLASYGDTGRNGIKTIPKEHIAFFRDCLDYYETEEHIFVHANYEYNLPLSQQTEDILRWKHLDVQSIRPHYSGKTVILGHTPQESGEILDLGFVKCIDTCCHGGGWLTALDVENGCYWQANEQGELRY